MARIFQATPVLYVRSIEEALALFVGTLGFTAEYQMDGYAYVVRDGAAIRILQVRDAHQFDPGKERYGCYIDVGDIDTLYEELKERLEMLPVGHVGGPEDRPYGQRELVVLAPDGQFIAFASPVAQQPA
jgi:catechol 2,3-dioxygenase-like lactoylglutathione lyase family enzyme